MSISPSTTSDTPTIDMVQQAKAEKAQRKADRAVHRLAKTEKAQRKANSSSNPSTNPPPSVSTSNSISIPITVTMPVSQQPPVPTSSTTSKQDKKRKTSSPGADLEPLTTSSSSTTLVPESNDPPVPKRQKSKKQKSAARQLEVPQDPIVVPVRPTSFTGDQEVDGQGDVVKTGGDGAEKVDELVPSTPEEDSKLDDQAKKALIYAQTHARNQQDPTIIWKFNKAKQNWLMRNVWSVELIPGRWVGLAIDYLKTMQGIARKNLVAEAKKHLATPIISKLSTDDEPSTETPESPTTPSSDAVVETADDDETKSESGMVIQDARTKEVKDRARRILTAVGIDCWSV